jgi:hypothetical protein
VFSEVVSQDCAGLGVSVGAKTERGTFGALRFEGQIGTIRSTFLTFEKHGCALDEFEVQAGLIKD